MQLPGLANGVGDGDRTLEEREGQWACLVEDLGRDHEEEEEKEERRKDEERNERCGEMAWGPGRM